MSTNPEELVSPRDAAREYGVSDRRLRQLADEGKLRREYAPRQAHQAKAPVFYRRADLEAWKAGTPDYHPMLQLARVTPAADGTGAAVAKAPKGSKAPTVAKAPNGMMVFERLLEAFGQPAAPLWVSIPEASRRSGLPADVLRERIAPVLAQSGCAIDVSSSGARPRWKILLAALTRPLVPPSA